MTIQELYDTYRREFPKLTWYYHKYSKHENKRVRAIYDKIIFESYIGNFDNRVYDGCEFISVSLEKELSGCSRPCIGLEEALSEMRENIKRLAPKLLEDEQLTLF